MIARRLFLRYFLGFLTAAPAGFWPVEASSADFTAFLLTLWPLAAEKGVRRSTFDSVTTSLTLDSSLQQTSRSQPEFDRPLQAYFKEAVSPARIAEGHRAAVTYHSALQASESRFGVPGEILLAAWAMESDFGRSRGKRDIFRSLATQAFTRPDRPLFRDEFIEALLILESGQIGRAQMTGSWAGAMGDPQFLPSAYRKYAVSAAGGRGAPDIWTNPPDILASIANFLRLSGWRPDRPWAKEVLLPDGFPVPSLHAGMAEWAAEGVRAGSGTLPAGGDAALFLPSGAAGPAFLLFENHWVLKQYNNSDSYALSLGLLAQRIAGGPVLTHAWPEQVINLSRTDKAFIQARLAALGLYEGAADGKFGPSSRDAIHAFQKRAGIRPADGFATPALVQNLRAAIR
jgi:membrane-bound lytic murein transglycosylase B